MKQKAAQNMRYYHGDFRRLTATPEVYARAYVIMRFCPT